MLRVWDAHRGIDHGGPLSMTAAATMPGQTAGALRAAPLLVLVGLGSLTIPTLYSFYSLIWLHDQDTHAPIILAGILYALWQKRALFDFSASRAEQIAALGIAGLGLTIYILGRSQTFLQLEGLGLIVVTYGAVLLAGGARAIRNLAYVTLLLIFVVPVPGTLVDVILVPLKMWLANFIVDLLALFGYPIANHGVVISIGFDQLQVADACAGLRSILSLSAIGLLFIYFIKSSRWIVSLLLVLATPLIALFANFFRVIALVLVTYHLGANAGADFHDYAAYIEVIVAVLAVLACYSLLEVFIGARKGAR
jgi:exosortase